MFIKVYHGFGHAHNLVVLGHVFRKQPFHPKRYSESPFTNMVQLLRLFFVRPIGGVKLTLLWYGKQLETISEKDGFFRFQFASPVETDAGWHPVCIVARNDKGEIIAEGCGDIYIPHKTQYAFISDIDDTIMVSHSATLLKRLNELLFKNFKTRTVFDHLPEYYKQLSFAQTSDDTPNPFFYVSSSEWNLYDYLKGIFRHQSLPEGAFLLNKVKKWYEMLKTGRTKHEGKLIRILRILEVFPLQRFVLFGDNSQVDPAIYALLTEKYADRIHAVYIRDVRKSRKELTLHHLKTIESRNVITCFFKESSEAHEHSKRIGLIR
jgi:phosphatidate phosphatase APP1